MNPAATTSLLKNALRTASATARVAGLGPRILGATESHAVPMPARIVRAIDNTARMPALRWAAGATESHATPVRMPLKM